VPQMEANNLSHSMATISNPLNRQSIQYDYQSRQMRHAGANLQLSSATFLLDVTYEQIKENNMKNAGFTALMASIALGLSLAAWAGTACQVADENVEHKGGFCKYVGGQFNGCTQDVQTNGKCISGSSFHCILKPNFKFTPNVYTQGRCASHLSDNSTGTFGFGCKATKGTVQLTIKYAVQTSAECVATPTADVSTVAE
jgi:hypothetical protein